MNLDNLEHGYVYQMHPDEREFWASIIPLEDDKYIFYFDEYGSCKAATDEQGKIYTLPEIYDVYDIPIWALTAIEYGDYSGMTENEGQLINDWLDSLPENCKFVYGSRDDFNPRPTFGLACTTFKTFVIL